MGFAVVIKGPETETRECKLAEGETSIGRDPANVLLLEGRGVSRRHAKLVVTGSRLTIIDQGSTYGTKVNGVITSRSDLVEGDIVTVGMHRLKVKQLPDEPEIKRAVTPTVEPFVPEEVTQAPHSDIHQRKTIQMNRNAIQFILDNPDEEGRAVKVLSRKDSKLVRAVKRLGTVSDAHAFARDTMPPHGADYQALLLMYKVSELLAAATDLDEFVQPMADLVLEEVGADTVVLLMSEADGELTPLVIRHRGSLTPGEVPVSRGIVDRVLKDGMAVMSNDLSQDSQIQPGRSVMLYNICAVMAFPLMVRGRLRGVLYLSRSVAKPFVGAEGDLMAALASLVASGIERSELKESIVREKQQRRALERFHPPEIVDRIYESGSGEVSLKEHQATVLVCNMEGFDTLAEQMEPRMLASVLHEFYEMLYEKVFANGGSLVKLHDGWSLALFGTMQTQDRDAVWAIEAARMLCREFETLAAFWPTSRHLSLRCALDTGTVVAGVVGSEDRMEYMATGRPITTAAAMARQATGTCVSFTERTWLELPKKRYEVESLQLLGDLKTFRLLMRKDG